VDDHARQDAAEQVRAHLVSLRGGAPFFSSADGQLLLRWLDEEVPVPRICMALESAAEARRKRPSRIPLSLSHAKRHLAKVSSGRLSALPDEIDTRAESSQEEDVHPFTPLCMLLEKHAGEQPSFTALATALHALDIDAYLVDNGLDLLRNCYATLWTELTDNERRSRISGGIEALGDLPTGLDESVVMAAAEEHARLQHLGQWPWLSSNTLWELAER
jgi:hypothetical protein